MKMKSFLVVLDRFGKPQAILQSNQGTKAHFLAVAIGGTAKLHDVALTKKGYLSRGTEIDRYFYTWAKENKEMVFDD